MKRRERESGFHNDFSVKTAKITLYRIRGTTLAKAFGNSECYPLGIPLLTERLVAEFVEGCHFLLYHVKVVHILTCPGR